MIATSTRHARAAALLPRAVPHERRARRPSCTSCPRTSRRSPTSTRSRSGCASPGGGRRGRDDLRVDPLTPTILAPFAALPTTGDATEAGAALRDRDPAPAARRPAADRRSSTPRTVLLPLSPNHGAFGGDGPYGETKAALEVLLKPRAGRAVGREHAVIAPRIGWVRGTGLMGANDAIAPLVEERLGVRTFAADEMGWLLAGLLVTQPRRRDRPRPAAWRQIADLRGALAAARRRAARALRPQRPRATGSARRSSRTPHTARCRRCPAPGTDAAPRTPQPAPAARPQARGPRRDRRHRRARPGRHRPQPLRAGARRARLAGRRRRARVADRPRPLRARALPRPLDRHAPRARRCPRSSSPRATPTRSAQRIGVRALGVRRHDRRGRPHRARAGDARAASHVRGRHRGRGARVTAATSAGTATAAASRISRRADPRPARRRRTPAASPASCPTGLDLARFGVPTDLIATADRMALVNLACTVEAFADAGLEPRGAARPRPPGQVANTQGAGMGGMASLRRLLLDHLLAEPSARTTASRSRSATSSPRTPSRPTSAPTAR